MGHGYQQAITLELEQSVEEWGELRCIKQAQGQCDFHRTPAQEVEAGAGDNAEIALKEKAIGDGTQAVRVTVRQWRALAQVWAPA
jgi:hypothetical protein